MELRNVNKQEGYFMKHEILLVIFTFFTFVTAVKVLSDIKSNRVTEYIVTYYFATFSAALSAAAGVATCVECYILKNYSLILFFAIMFATVGLQILISILVARLKQNRDEDEFEIYDYEVIDGQKNKSYTENNEEREDLKQKFRRVK